MNVTNSLLLFLFICSQIFDRNVCVGQDEEEIFYDALEEPSDPVIGSDRNIESTPASVIPDTPENESADTVSIGSELDESNPQEIEDLVSDPQWFRFLSKIALRSKLIPYLLRRRITKSLFYAVSTIWNVSTVDYIESFLATTVIETGLDIFLEETIRSFGVEENTEEIVSNLIYQYKEYFILYIQNFRMEDLVPNFPAMQEICSAGNLLKKEYRKNYNSSSLSLNSINVVIEELKPSIIEAVTNMFNPNDELNIARIIVKLFVKPFNNKLISSISYNLGLVLTKDISSGKLLGQIEGTVCTNEAALFATFNSFVQSRTSQIETLELPSLNIFFFPSTLDAIISPDVFIMKILPDEYVKAIGLKNLDCLFSPFATNWYSKNINVKITAEANDVFRIVVTLKKCKNHVELFTTPVPEPMKRTMLLLVKTFRRINFLSIQVHNSSATIFFKGKIFSWKVKKIHIPVYTTPGLTSENTINILHRIEKKSCRTKIFGGCTRFFGIDGKENIIRFEVLQSMKYTSWIIRGAQCIFIEPHYVVAKSADIPFGIYHFLIAADFVYNVEKFLMSNPGPLTITKKDNFVWLFNEKDEPVVFEMSVTSSISLQIIENAIESAKELVNRGTFLNKELSVPILAFLTYARKLSWSDSVRKNIQLKQMNDNGVYLTESGKAYYARVRQVMDTVVHSSKTACFKNVAANVANEIARIRNKLDQNNRYKTLYLEAKLSREVGDVDLKDVWSYFPPVIEYGVEGNVRTSKSGEIFCSAVFQEALEGYVFVVSMTKIKDPNSYHLREICTIINDIVKTFRDTDKTISNEILEKISTVTLLTKNALRKYSKPNIDFSSQLKKIGNNALIGCDADLLKSSTLTFTEFVDTTLQFEPLYRAFGRYLEMVEIIEFNENAIDWFTTKFKIWNPFLPYEVPVTLLKSSDEMHKLKSNINVNEIMMGYFYLLLEEQYPSINIMSSFEKIGEIDMNEYIIRGRRIVCQYGSILRNEQDFIYMLVFIRIPSIETPSIDKSIINAILALWELTRPSFTLQQVLEQKVLNTFCDYNGEPNDNLCIDRNCIPENGPKITIPNFENYFSKMVAPQLQQFCSNTNIDTEKKKFSFHNIPEGYNLKSILNDAVTSVGKKNHDIFQDSKLFLKTKTNGFFLEVANILNKELFDNLGFLTSKIFKILNLSSEGTVQSIETCIYEIILAASNSIRERIKHKRGNRRRRNFVSSALQPLRELYRRNEKFNQCHVVTKICSLSEKFDASSKKQMLEKPVPKLLNELESFYGEQKEIREKINVDLPEHSADMNPLLRSCGPEESTFYSNVLQTVKSGAMTAATSLFSHLPTTMQKTAVGWVKKVATTFSSVTNSAIQSLSFIVGEEVMKIITKNDLFKERILKFLTDDSSGSSFIDKIADYTKKEIERFFDTCSANVLVQSSVLAELLHTQLSSTIQYLGTPEAEKFIYSQLKYIKSNDKLLSLAHISLETIVDLLITLHKIDFGESYEGTKLSHVVVKQFKAIIEATQTYMKAACGDRELRTTISEMMHRSTKKLFTSVVKEFQNQGSTSEFFVWISSLLDRDVQKDAQTTAAFELTKIMTHTVSQATVV